MTKDQATKRRSYHLSLYQMQGIVKITERPDYKEVLKINIGEAIYRLMCHDKLFAALEEIVLIGNELKEYNAKLSKEARRCFAVAKQALNHAKGDS